MDDIKIPVNVEADITESANELGHAINKPVTKVSDIVTGTFTIVLGWIPHLSKKLDIYFSVDAENYKTKLEEKYNKIPEDNIIEPDIQILSQAASKASYCLDKEELSEMFANLIISTMDKDKADYTHPSFADIITQMSPFDANNLLKFQKHQFYSIKSFNSSNVTPSEWLSEVKGDITTIGKIREQYQQSITVLHKLGLVEFSYTSIKDLGKMDIRNSIDMKPSGITLTKFGENFLKTVT